MSAQARIPRKTKVRWTEEELKRVIDESVIVSLEDTDNLWRHMEVAQRRVLPADRQRLIIGSLVATDKIKSEFEAARREFLAQKEKVEVKVEVPVPQPINRAEIIASITNAELFDLAMQRLGPIFIGIGALAGTIEKHLGKTGTVNTSTAEAPTTPTTPSAVPPTTPTPQSAVTQTPLPTVPPVPKRTRVLMFGFPIDIEFEVKNKGGNFDLELLFAAQQPGEGAPKIPKCDWCIVNNRIELSRRAKAALHLRPGKDCLFHFGSAEKVLKQLADLNSRKR